MAEQLPDVIQPKGAAGSRLPEAILARARQSVGGETAWRDADIAEAHAALADAGYAIGYGNVQAVLLGKYTWEWPPTSPYNVALIWMTDLRQLGEAWTEYAHRVAQESLEKLTRLRVNDILDRDRLDEAARDLFEKSERNGGLTAMPSPAWEIVYSLGFDTEEEYQALHGETRTEDVV